MRHPSLFISHGAPTNATEDNDFTRSLSRLAGELRRPEAILVVSAHWMTRGVHVTGSAEPETIHDFYGFPKELYEIRYPASGATALVPEIKKLVADGLAVDPTRGLDHGVWSVLRYLFPKADVPVLQLSIDTQRDPMGHFELGRALRPLREAGVLIIGSGNMTHNLHAVDFHNPNAAPPEWAQDFDRWAAAALETGNDDSILKMEAPPGLYARNHPTSEHFIPLLYAMGARHTDEAARFPYVGFQFGCLSMRCVAFG